MLLLRLTRRSLTATAAAVMSLAVAAVLPVRPSPATAGPPASYYTVAQAAQGARLYAVNCSRCHGVDLLGGGAPPLIGPAFRRRWPIRTLYRFAARQMPADRRGSLSPATYSAILAFLLQRNGHPAGAMPLTAARASAITATL
jgi:mono/diheme cytochrome c family protein